MRKLLLLCLLTAVVATAAPQDIRVTKTRTYAGSEMVKSIYVEVTVKNTSNVVDEDRVVHLRFVPRKPGSYRPPEEGKDLFSPFDMEQDLGTLNPGESRTLKFKSPYLAKNQFSSTARSFTTDVAPDLPINGSTQVTLEVTIR